MNKWTEYSNTFLHGRRPAAKSEMNVQCVKHYFVLKIPRPRPYNKYNWSRTRETWLPFFETWGSYRLGFGPQSQAANLECEIRCYVRIKWGIKAMIAIMILLGIPRPQSMCSMQAWWLFLRADDSMQRSRYWKVDLTLPWCGESTWSMRMIVEGSGGLATH